MPTKLQNWLLQVQSQLETGSARVLSNRRGRHSWFRSVLLQVVCIDTVKDSLRRGVWVPPRWVL